MRRDAHWFRMVWRNDQWQYFGERLKPVGIRAHQRHQAAYGDVWPGEIVAKHDRGGPVDTMHLVTAGDRDMVKLEFANRRDGQLSVKLPLGGELVLPNPRRHR